MNRVASVQLADLSFPIYDLYTVYRCNHHPGALV